MITAGRACGGLCRACRQSRQGRQGNYSPKDTSTNSFGRLSTLFCGLSTIGGVLCIAAAAVGVNLKSCTVCRAAAGCGGYRRGIRLIHTLT